MVDELTKGPSPETFAATIDQVLEKFDSLKPLYVAHYKQKKPSISDDALDKLKSKATHPGCVIREVTNSISAGIYISHGHASIYGSDVQDWAKYEELSLELPDLRLPVESFEHFCLLLEKDPTTINTAALHCILATFYSPNSLSTVFRRIFAGCFSQHCTSRIIE